ncbi:hypothetical protein HanXRQr2_Chr03g0120761 [Helianthus annuus]|uniref:Uncharacterized protein n=1 Tax=Helianthus annuus TaxID=4232 RepID=A0A9K3JIQ6_HELAN|nr:hypothetical protein HanXRQr2_Chr03g0120761 [Helianthus annuus]KAJ0944480.1 hypothetical protein HanPSC8_Chr03g0117261 [Helianthus annuus]
MTQILINKYHSREKEHAQTIQQTCLAVKQYLWVLHDGFFTEIFIKNTN